MTKTKMNKIKLNFIEIDKQDTSFPIYRKKSNKKGDSPYFGSLPIKQKVSFDKEIQYESYQIKLEPSEGFELFDYYFQYNNLFSSKLLFDKLVESISESNFFDFEVKDGFLRTLELTIEEVSIGRRVAIISAYVLKEYSKIGFLIDYGFREKEENTNKKESQRYSLSLDRNYHSNRNFYKEKYTFLNSVIKKLPSLNIQGKIFKINDNFLSLESYSLKNKEYIFKSGNLANSQFQGIKNFGPYQNIPFEKNIDFYFIFKDEHKDLANNIYLGLLGKLSPGTFPGLKSFFQLDINKSNVKRVRLDSPTLDSAQKSVAKVLSEVSHNFKNLPFVLYIEDNDFDDVQHELYYFLKHEFLKNKVPIQVLNNEKIGTYETLKWSISSIALQIFAKLGGTPWLVKPSNNDCLILGIGQAYEKNLETGLNKQFAYSVCLDSTGVYKKIEILSKEGETENYLNSIKESIRNILSSNEFSTYKKCAIHIPFKIPNNIINSIAEIAKKINNIEVRVIKINTKNKFFGYSDHNTMVPYESSFIKLNRGEYLVWFEGLNYGKEIVYKKVANPIHIEFLDSNDISIEDEQSYLQDILNLSGANWRGFNAKAKPISIFYSELIAEYSIELQKMEGFDSRIFAQSKPWFL
ncbi:MAG: hypothetical protein ACK4TA_20290 [Saprospiraceae bacterium]